MLSSNTKTLFTTPKKRKRSLSEFVEAVQNEIKNNPELSNKAQRLYETIASINKHHETKITAADYDDEEEKTSLPTTGLRNRHDASYFKQPANNNVPIIEKPLKPVTKNDYQVPSFVGHMAKTIIPGYLGPVALILSGAGLVSALPAGLSVQSGSDGGQDLCSGLAWCIQAAVTNITDNSLVAQFSRDFGLTNSQGSFLTEVAEGDCFGQGKLGGMISSVLDSIPDWYASSGETSCAASSSIWQNMQVTGSATHLSGDGCLQFQSALQNTASSCFTAAVEAEAAGIGIGIAVGAILLAAACYIGCKCYCQNR